jgi:hypothetical protein
MVDEACLAVDAKVMSLFQPDTLIPFQFLAVRKRTAHEAEQRLMLAVFEDAIKCFQRHLLAEDERGKGLFAETEEWIAEQSDRELFSFEHICSVFGFDPKYIRKGLAEWKKAEMVAREDPAAHPRSRCAFQ